MDFSCKTSILRQMLDYCKNWSGGLLEELCQCYSLPSFPNSTTLDKLP